MARKDRSNMLAWLAVEEDDRIPRGVIVATDLAGWTYSFITDDGEVHIGVIPYPEVG